MIPKSGHRFSDQTMRKQVSMIGAAKLPQPAHIGPELKARHDAETVMARYLEAQTGHKLAIAALLASLLICLTAAPALAQSVPLPTCLLYTSDAADEEDSVDLGGRRIIKKKKKN